MSAQPILSRGTKVELFVALAVVALFLYAREDLGMWVSSWLPAQAAHANCKPPATEHEELHVVLAWRDGQLVHTGCLYVGSQSAYRKERR